MLFNPNAQSVVHPGESKDGHVIGISNVTTDWFAKQCIDRLTLFRRDFDVAILVNPNIANLLWNGSDAIAPNPDNLASRDKSGRTSYLEKTFGYKCIKRLNVYRAELNAKIKNVAGE
jgi:hypothetical protein